MEGPAGGEPAERPAEGEALNRDTEESEGLIHEEGPAPYTGHFAEIKALLNAGRIEPAVAAARAWREQDPGDVLALLALGESLAAGGEPATAARAYGSLIDLYPWRADLRRHAGSGSKASALPKVSLWRWTPTRKSSPTAPIILRATALTPMPCSPHGASKRPSKPSPRAWHGVIPTVASMASARYSARTSA